jgi:hypothetical protein
MRVMKMPEMQTITEELREKRARRDRGFKVTMSACIVVIVLGLGWITWWANDKSGQRDAQISQINEQFKTVCRNTPAKDTASIDTCNRVERNELAPPPAAPVAPVGPSAEQVYASVVSYCANHGQCKGVDGQTPDFGKIVQNVRALIPTPANGSNGSDAPPVTDSQIQARVDAYCGQSTNPCQGPTGATGATGATGVPGVPGTPGEPGKPGADGEPGLSTREVRTNLDTCTTTTTMTNGETRVTPIEGCTPNP